MLPFKVGDICRVNPDYSSPFSDVPRIRRIYESGIILRIIIIRQYTHSCFCDLESHSGMRISSVDVDALIKYPFL